MNNDQTIQHTSGSFTTTDGLSLFEQWWEPAGEYKAMLIIVHGLVEHSGRYAHVAEFFAKRGYSVGTFDLRGHGKSEGKRSLIRSFDNYLNDLGIFLERAHQKIGRKPIFLLGHSMGGTIVAKYMLTRQLDVKGIVITGGGIKLPQNIPPILSPVVHLVALIFPEMPTLALDARTVSRDPQVVKQYDNDPLNFRGKLPASTGTEMSNAFTFIQKNSNKTTPPILIMSGSEDTMVDPQGSRILYDNLLTKDKTLKIYEGLYHEILNEPEQEQVMEDILSWMQAHL
jgi:acylglycerol lipase